MRRSIHFFMCLAVFTGSLVGCQESEPNPNWTADTGVDAADAHSDAMGDADAADGERDAEDVPDMRAGDARDGAGEDTRPECSKDSDGDRLYNCDEAELCTSPTKSDTDGDGLNDFDELAEGTNPCEADTDDDGLDDPAELDLGLNPNDPQTFDDGVRDGNRWRVGACDPPAGPSKKVTESVDYFTSQAGNYKFGIPQDFDRFEHVGLTGVQPPVAASLFGENAHSLYGFVLSKNAEDGRTDPTVSLRETVRPEILKIAGDSENNLILDTWSGPFQTHDDHLASIGRFRIKTPMAKTPARVREELVLGMDAFSQGDVAGGLPSDGGSTYTSFGIFVSVIQRTKSSGPNQVVLSAAVVPQSLYDDNPQVQFDMDDLTNTTQISEAGRSVAVGCVSTHPQGRRTGYSFPEVPVSGSLRVLVESDQDPTMATVVPRSREEGFAYFSKDNAVRMYGDYPQGYTGEYPEDFVALRYEYFASP